MKSIIYLHILFFCSIYCTLFGQDTLPVKRSYHIIKTTEPIIVDGVLSESFWNVAESQSDFTQFEPMPFAKTEFKTVVRMSFTDQYIYVGAQLYDDPNKVSAQVTSRDELGETNVDYFTMSLDTYDDDLTGFRFIVTAAGVQADARLGKFETDNGTNLLDFNWDGVWESAVQKSNDGWSVEMKIPLFNLRFPKKTDQTWGLQFARFVKRNGETSSWQAINPNINGIVRQYGNLVGIKDIKNALRLSLHPYISLNYKSAPSNQANEENTHLQVQKGISGGMDIKYGINENFTLDATVIPDFSQVASDQKVLNLSPFEQRFEERRPFFTEAVDLFNKCNIFYSRRVGGIPYSYLQINPNLSEYEIIQSIPFEAQLYNASKFSGRTPSKWGIGIFNAVSAPAYAKIKNMNSGSTKKILVSPLTNYNVTVIQKLLPNQSSVSLINASTLRSGLYRDANVSGLEYIQKDKKNNYQFAIIPKISAIFNPGSRVRLGYTNEASFGKISGKINWNIWNDIISDRWDPSDLGYYSGNNRMTSGGGITYNQTSANKYFNSSNWWINGGYSNQYSPFKYANWFSNIGFWAGLKNQGSVNWWNYIQPFASYDFNEPRIAGKKLRILPYWNNGFNFSTDSRKKMRLFAYYSTSIEPRKNYYNFSFGIELSYRFNDKINVSYNLFYSPLYNERGYVTNVSEDEIIIGERKQVTLSHSIYFKYNMTKLASFSIIARHYNTNLIHNRFYELQDDGSLGTSNYDGEHDFSIQFFNIDAVLQYQFRPGSYLTLVWKNSAEHSQTIDNKKQPDYGNQLDKILSAAKDNLFSVKMVYFLNGAKYLKR